MAALAVSDKVVKISLLAIAAIRIVILVKEWSHLKGLKNN